jgi:hypothetical protein
MSVLTGSGVAGLFCILFIIGLVIPKHVYDDLRAENAELKAERKAERDRADAAVAAAEATRNIMASFQAGRSLTGGPPP